MAKKTLGEYITENRHKKKMTKRQLASLIGVSPTEIYRIENGLRKKPKLSVLKNIAKELEITDKELFSRIELEYDNKVILQSMFPNLTENQIEHIYIQAKELEKQKKE